VTRSRSVVAVFALLFVVVALARPEGTEVERLDCRSAIFRAGELDGRIVEIEAEAIGCRMARGSYSWINIGGFGKALGAWAPSEVIPEELSFGSWSRTGDTLLVRGILNKACAEHGGELDIHAASIEIAARGAPTPHPVEPSRLAAAIGLVLVAAALLPVWLARERAARRRTGAGGRDRIRSLKERKGTGVLCLRESSSWWLSEALRVRPISCDGRCGRPGP
jgi:hypothetical protein